MAKRKEKVNNEIVKDLSIDESININPKEEVNIEDNPLSKKVTPIIDNVTHNKNNEILTDSDLINNVII